MSDDWQRCTDLAEDQALWSSQAPLSPPIWFREQIHPFSLAVRAAADGETERARLLLDGVQSAQLRAWYVEQGRFSGAKRHMLLGRPHAKQFGPSIEHRMPDTRTEHAILLRDGFRCRYCGITLIHKRLLIDFGKTIGTDEFRAQTDSARHGSLVAFRANFDHVLPPRLGGSNGLENLAACCWSCNYGKGARTLEQMRLEDPMKREVDTSTWNGLVDIASPLALQARRAERLRRLATT